METVTGLMGWSWGASPGAPCSHAMGEDMPFTFEMPGRVDDAPPPSSKAFRKLDLPDGEHWVMAKGGGSQVEGAYLNYLNEELTRANAAHEAGELDQAGLAAAELAFNAGLATFLADRVTEHNLTNSAGEPLPLGLGLFWEMPGMDAARLCWHIQIRPSFFADPKAESVSPGG